MSDWFEDGGLCDALYPAMFPEERLEAAQTEIEQVQELAGHRGGGVLDLCCGPGRHSVTVATKKQAESARTGRLRDVFPCGFACFLGIILV